jgi:hypothetical protein
MGAMRVTAYAPRIQKTVNFKWKEVPSRLDHFNTSPRREVAAYQIQQLFLEPEDFVVPTSLILCLPLDRYIQRIPDATPTISGTHCVLGNASIWLTDVTVPEKLYNEARFLTDATYAYYVANLNLLTYLIDHRDGRAGNFMVSQNNARRQAYSIDNGMSFGSLPYNPFISHWNVIRVPAVPQNAIERLRRIQRDDLAFLGVVTQLQENDKRVLVPVPAGGNLDPERGVRVKVTAAGLVVQFGLTASEIDAIWKRIQQLIEDVDQGRLQVF